MPQTQFSWMPAYAAIAQGIYDMRNDRSRLLKLFKSIFSDESDLTFPMDTEAEELVTIDPFTFFATFNRGVSPEKRNRIVRLALDGLGSQDVATPTDYEGLPVVNNMKSWFFGGKQDRGAHDIDNLWELFCAAMELAANPAGKQQRLQMAHMFDGECGTHPGPPRPGAPGAVGARLSYRTPSSRPRGRP